MRTFAACRPGPPPSRFARSPPGAAWPPRLSGSTKSDRRLAFIVFAQRIGFTLDEIREELARLPHDRTPSRGDWSAIASAWTSRIDTRLAELRRLRDSLTQCIGCGCLSLDRCRAANPLDRAATGGPGPRYWLG